jgi:hypothetical protein
MLQNVVGFVILSGIKTVEIRPVLTGKRRFRVGIPSFEPELKLLIFFHSRRTIGAINSWACEIPAGTAFGAILAS